MKRQVPLVLAALFVATALLAQTTAPATAARASGIDRSTFDTATRPQDDLYTHVNGAWLKTNPIPPDRSRWGVDAILAEENLLKLRAILDDLRTRTDLNPERRKLRDFYVTATDEAAIERQGLSPLAGELAVIADMKTPTDLFTMITHLRGEGTSILFNFWVSQDEKASERYAIHLHQGGLGLPEPEYYLEKSESAQRLRDQYRQHVEAMFRLMGDAPDLATRNTDAVISIETRLAEKSRNPEERRDEEAQYNKRPFAELPALTPHFSWKDFCENNDLFNIPFVIVGQPEFFTRMDELLTTVPIEQWRAYLRWHLVHEYAFALSSPFVNEDFAFFGKILQGRQELQPRWKRAIRAVDHNMGDALGRLYVEKHFPPEARRRMDELVKNVRVACRERIESRTWMGPETRKQALAKLDTFMTKIGYPDKWRDTSALQVSTDSFARNVLRAGRFDTRYWFNKIKQPVDRTEWFMTAPTVNAYYSSTMNEIVFPAGILQPPHFNPAADDAVNYGAIGSVIAHEITHGFDDQGSRSDAQGNLKDWWTPDDRARFTALTEQVVGQYNASVVIDDLHINGKLTLGENIADFGGLSLAYAAYQKSINNNPAPIIDGTTGPQRFFLGYAQSWRELCRPEDRRRLLRVDPHSPPQFRVNIPLANFTPFYEAFNVEPGDKLYLAPEKRVEIW